MAWLSEKQRLFCDEYLIDLNATRAYKKIYTKTKKDSTAAVCASKLLRVAKVRAYLDEKLKARQDRVEISQDMIIRELAAIAFADIGEVVSIENGSARYANTDELPKESRKMIAGIKEGRDGVEVKMYDRLRALELLGKHLGMFGEKKDESGREPVQISFGNTEEDSE